MPTGVLVSPAMNHGGPLAASGHAGFTAVGIRATLLRDKNPTGTMRRRIDGQWAQHDVPIAAK
jgi:2,5-dioxopentanoate dehydrogenase